MPYLVLMSRPDDGLESQQSSEFRIDREIFHLPENGNFSPEKFSREESSRESRNRALTLVGRRGGERGGPLARWGRRETHHQPAVKGLLAAVATDRREVSSGGRVRAPLRFFGVASATSKERAAQVS